MSIQAQATRPEMSTEDFSFLWHWLLGSAHPSHSAAGLVNVGNSFSLYSKAGTVSLRSMQKVV